MAKSVADYQTAFQNFMEKGARYYACPTGTMLPFAGKTVPAGFLLCNGAAISRTTYARLFSVLGTTWGAGDGSTTFNLPNVNDRCLEGTTNTANVGKYLEAGLPDITGGGLNSEATYTADGVYKGSGCVKATDDGGSNPNRNLPAGSQYAWCWWSIDASWSNIKYGASATVQPIAFQVLMIVKA